MEKALCCKSFKTKVCKVFEKLVNLYTLVVYPVNNRNITSLYQMINTKKERVGPRSTKWIQSGASKETQDNPMREALPSQQIFHPAPLGLGNGHAIGFRLTAWRPKSTHTSQPGKSYQKVNITSLWLCTRNSQQVGKIRWSSRLPTGTKFSFTECPSV